MCMLAHIHNVYNAPVSNALCVCYCQCFILMLNITMHFLS